MSSTPVNHGGHISSTVLGLNKVLICSTDDVLPSTYSTCSLLTANNVTLTEGARFPTDLRDAIGIARLSSSRAVLCNGGSGIRGACSVLTTIGTSLSIGSTLRFEQHLSVRDVSIAYLQTDAVALCYISLDAASETVLLCAKLVSESFGLSYGTEITLWNQGTDPPSIVQLVQLDLNKVMACYAGSLLGMRCNILQASGMTLARGTTLKVTEDPVQLMAITPVDVNQAAIGYVVGDRSILTGSVSTSLYGALVVSGQVSTDLTLRQKPYLISATRSVNAYNSIALAAADVYEVVLCAVTVSPTVRGWCSHVSVSTQGEFLKGPEQAFFTSASTTLDLARLGTLRTQMCTKMPQHFSNCTVLYNLPKYQSEVHKGLIGKLVHRGTSSWWIPVVVVSIVVGLCVIGGIAFYFLSGPSEINERAQELVRRKKKNSNDPDGGGYDPVSSGSRDSRPPTAGPRPASAPAGSTRPPTATPSYRPASMPAQSSMRSSRVTGEFSVPADGQYPTGYSSMPAQHSGSYSGGRQYVMA